MPKRHRQPEPVKTTAKAGRVEPTKAPTTTTAPAAATAARQVQKQKPNKTKLSTADSLASSTSGVFPATPAAVHEKKRRAEARAKRVEAATSADGGLSDGSSASSGDVHSQFPSDAMSFDSSQIGDDGNQDYYGSHSDEDLSVSSSEQDDMRAMRRAVRANRVAAASRRKSRAMAPATTTSTDSEEDSNASEEERRGIEDDDPLDMNAPIQQLTTSSSDDDDDDDDVSESTNGSDEEEEDDEDLSVDEEHGIYEFDEEDDDDDDEEEQDSNDNDDEDDDEDDDDDSDREQVTVDFGVYDMEKKHIDAVMHLMDQLCPDKMNEIDRDDLGAAFAENPYTYVVKVGDNDDNANDAPADEEEEEFYGLVSLLDVAHGLQRHPAAFRPMQTLLKEQVWRTVHAGLPPTEILTSLTDDKAKLAKCCLLVAEYIRNVPVELSVQILEDVVRRLDDRSEKGKDAAKGTAKGEETADGKDPASVRLTKPCMCAVLAKVQRSVDAPVTLVKKSQKKPSEASSGDGAKDEKLDLESYIFWRQEDRTLFNFRDTRIATYAYRCRPQYDGQPEQEIPISLLFVLQHGAILQAIDEIKKQDLTKTEITRFY